MSVPEPMVSFVVTSRNDDHGGSLLHRMQLFVSGLIEQCKRHFLDAELVLVEWNPPPERPRFAQALKWPADTRPCRVRIIEVSKELHLRYAHGEALPLFQMIAKNIGIRRARGKFVLATNIDILFSDELMKWMASGEMKPGLMYRIDRHDAMAEVPVDAPVAKQLEWCGAHLIRLNAVEGTFALGPDGRRAIAANDIVSADAGVRFGPGWFGVERGAHGQVFRWVDNDAELRILPQPGCSGRLALDLEPGPGVRTGCFELQVLDGEGRCVSRGPVKGRCVVRLALPVVAGRENLFRVKVEGGGTPTALTPRLLNFRVFSFTWTDAEPASVAAAAPGALNFSVDDFGSDDIVEHGSGIRIGGGWYQYEGFNDATFRWASYDAELVVTTPPGPLRQIQLDIEPGPGMGAQPLDLQVLDENKELLSRHRILRRGCCEIPLPLERGRTRVFILHVEGGGNMIPGDTRVLNFRVYKCGWSKHLLDIGDEHNPDQSVKAGAGWGPVECARDGVFRCVEKDSELVLKAPPEYPRTLIMDVEALPAGSSVHLQVLDHACRLLASTDVKGRQTLEAALPIRPGRVHVFHLRAVPAEGGAGVPSAGTEAGPTTARLRVRNCRWSQRFADIYCQDDGIKIGEGWYDLEYAQGETMRWVNNDAELVLSTRLEPPPALNMEVQAGPGIGKTAFELKVLDQAGQVVARTGVNGRQILSLKLPLAPGKTHPYTLHVDGGGATIPSDPRVLNFRVFHCAWDDRPFSKSRIRALAGASAGPISASERTSTPADTAVPPVTTAQSNGRRGDLWGALQSLRSAKSDAPHLVPLHTNGCGDFTLMAREHWLDLRGYAEFEAFSFHIDGLFCYCAHHGGAREEMLRDPMRIYHIEHGSGSGWTPEGQAQLFARIAAKGIPCVEYPDFIGWACDMHRLSMPLIFNGEYWGLAQENLPETVL